MSVDAVPAEQKPGVLKMILDDMINERLVTKAASSKSTPSGIFSIMLTGRRTISAWLHSPPHRHNLLSPRVDIVGLGTAGAGRGVYVTADFAG